MLCLKRVSEIVVKRDIALAVLIKQDYKENYDHRSVIL